MNTKEYPETIIVPADATPGYLNDETVSGAIIGNIVAGDAGQGMLGGAGGVVGALAGGMIGGAIGKQRMENEYQHGRAVHKPGSTRASIGIGALVGALVTGLFAAAVVISSISGALPIAAAIVAVGAAIGGGMGYLNHNKAEKDYEAAKAYYDSHGGSYEGREREAHKAHGKAYQVTPEEYALLQERMNSKEHSHAHAAEASHDAAHQPAR